MANIEKLGRLALKEKEYNKIVQFSEHIRLPKEQPTGQRAVGCKGCEGGCAAEICAR